MYFQRKIPIIPLIDGFDGTSILLSAILVFVTDAYASLHIADVIDATIPKTRHHNPNHSQVISYHFKRSPKQSMIYLISVTCIFG